MGDKCKCNTYRYGIYNDYYDSHAEHIVNVEKVCIECKSEIDTVNLGVIYDFDQKKLAKLFNLIKS